MALSHPTTALALPQQLDASRMKRLLDELGFALSRTDAKTLRAWGVRSSTRLVKLTGSRISALASLVTMVGRGAVQETKGMAKAAKDRQLGKHVGDRTAAAIDGTIDLAQSGSALFKSIGQALASDPKTNAPKVLAAFLGFYAGSGGVDGDGGIPDLDLLAGIDAHRSLLTHSILAGVLAEGLLLSIVDLSSQINERLPLDHDLLWDRLAEASAPLAGALTAGASAGIAYHLLWDATIEPAPYKGLPFEMSMEAHQAAMGASGAAEAAYVANRKRRIVTYDQSEQQITTGRKIVEGVAQTAHLASQVVRGFWAGFTGKS